MREENPGTEKTPNRQSRQNANHFQYGVLANDATEGRIVFGGLAFSLHDCMLN
jgi:hypothetical protein